MIYFFLASVLGLAHGTTYDGYWHFENISIAGAETWNAYHTPGDSAQWMGYEKTSDDLQLALHICDQYPKCMWLNGQGGYPGAIGWWNTSTKQDSYIKHNVGNVVKGSKYSANMYVHINKPVNIYCTMVAGPWSLPPDYIKAECDKQMMCDGFVVMRDLSSGFLCQFNETVIGPFDSYVKLPCRTSAALM